MFDLDAGSGLHNVIRVIEFSYGHGHRFVLTPNERGCIETMKLSHLRGIMCIPCDKYFLISLMEHWFDDTNTFHFSIGEMMITLIDIHHIIWVTIKGTLI